MPASDGPTAVTAYRESYDELLTQAVTALTAAARLSWTSNAPDGQPVTGAADWAEFVSLALAGAAANLGGIEAILAGRPGSWEADHVRNLLASTVGHDEQYLLEHRTEPVVVSLFVDEIMCDQGVWQSYEDARRELERRYAAIGLPAVGDDETEIKTVGGLDRVTPEQGRQADAIDYLEEALDRQREQDWAEYGQALKAHVEANAAQTAGLTVPVVVNVDLETFRRVGSESDDWWGIEERWAAAAINETPLPGGASDPLERLQQTAK
jgi:hypothetical protein